MRGSIRKGCPTWRWSMCRAQPLTDWCDAHRLGIAERLRLFLQVLEAVQYAHEKQVIHRDLKPSNILVTESGQVRLLDFGVARLLEAEETDQPALTSVYGRALTPDYASPELLRGDPIDARSDSLLPGRIALRAADRHSTLSAQERGLDRGARSGHRHARGEEAQHAARAGGSRYPRSTVERLARQLRGDLDAIVLKALAKEPAQRYPSAAALAEDLRRLPGWQAHPGAAGASRLSSAQVRAAQ